MSWVKKRGSNPAPTAAPPSVPMYNPNNQDQMNQWSGGSQVQDNWYNQQQQFQQQNQQQQNYWQQYNPGNYNQVYGQQQQQQFQNQYPSGGSTGNYRNNAGGYEDQSYGNVQYNTEQYNQNTVYENRRNEADVWNQAWGDEDNSNVASNLPTAGAVDDAFANDTAWNWGVEETAATITTAEPKKNEKLKGKLETPQWSTESQVSQESSDDVVPTSESLMSRNSTISHSPVQEEGAVKSDGLDGFANFENKQIVDKKVKKPDGWQNLYNPRFNQVNLETVPDNSEQPDPVPIQSFQKVKTSISSPDNVETPINDRNQYLETGQLTETTVSQNFEFIPDSHDIIPPPGLHRMVPGQLEQNNVIASSNNYDTQDKEPPPGLKRMVPGQIEQKDDARINRMVLGQNEVESNDQVVVNDSLRSGYDLPGPPEGLHRMIPGESSSPESNLRQLRPEQNDSETEFQIIQPVSQQPRSATIGADTPPIQLATKDGNVKENTSERRDSIEGQNHESEMITSITNSTRNLTLNEDNQQEQQGNRRRESSDSDREHKKPPRAPRDRKPGERSRRDDDRNRNRDKYSPESYSRRYRDNRRYEDDTDYYSDKEKDGRIQDDRDRDYERKYGSLRRDKDNKNRRRRDHRDYRRDYYYERDRGYEDDYDNYEGNRSRPSSRSDSMHESYRDRHEKEHMERKHDKDRDRYRRRRDPRDLYARYQGYLSYDSYNPYYQQYQYYENLRRTNPHAYAEWYRKYYQQSTGHTPSYGGEDRASVHSGRSSANDEIAKDRYTRQSFYSNIGHSTFYADSHVTSYSRGYDRADSSLMVEDSSSLQAQRLTPTKFSIAHLKAAISSGKLLRVFPNYPLDGNPGLVEISCLESLLGNNEDYKELSIFPGPLIKGVTHKKTIIEYCENKIRTACYNQDIVDPDSYILMWELLILLVRQNGMVVGTDIAELLLKNTKSSQQRPASAMSNVSNITGENPDTADGNNVLREEEVTNKFREFLLYGSGQEALEWAMKNGLWGHALFLASKLDKRTYANVMMRFANGLTLNDPLQTLYQLLSGKIPAAVTCVADEKWGDWRPHLAMILSNSSQRPELNCKAITTLGDTLKYRGSLYAAQFCYLMAEVGFSHHENPDAHLVLLGADHGKPFPSFVTNESIHMTEIYEYTCSLNDSDFIIPQFQVYKFMLATRLAEVGLLEKALAYLEKISAFIVSNPSAVSVGFVNNVFDLADKLKYNDPVGEVEDESQFGTVLETSRPDNSWLKDLKAVQNDLQAGVVYQEYQPSVVDSYDFQQQEVAWQNPNQYDISNVQNTQVWPLQQQEQPPVNNEYQHQNDFSQVNYEQQQQQQQQLQQQNVWNEDNQRQQWGEQFNQYHTDNNAQQTYFNSNLQEEPKEVEKEPEESFEQKPQITMPGQQLPKEENSQEKIEKKPSPVKTVKDVQGQSSTGWFGGIFSKLSLKPKNQMKLPEDKNPKIVWDETKKRWINVDEDPNDPSNEFKPPPKMSEILPKTEAVRPPSLPSANDELKMQSNMFKLQRTRNLKNSYVDVFNPSKPASGGPTSLPSSNSNFSSMPQMNFFIPQPVIDPNAPVDFLTPGGVPQLPETQMSRWSSTSSLSREVQRYMNKPPNPSHLLNT